MTVRTNYRITQPFKKWSSSCSQGMSLLTSYMKCLCLVEAAEDES